MNWTLYQKENYITTTWSGGTTTQLAIAPEGAVYADRDFLWRLSSARVELEHSDFTSLPDYNRLISVVKGDLDMKIGNGQRFRLAPCQVCSFDGGVPVESWGQCTDFNLMLRKGKCQGVTQSLVLEAGSALRWSAPVPAPLGHAQCTLALYCVSGELCLTQAGLFASQGELLLCTAADETAIALSSTTGAEILVSAIYTEST